MKKKFLSCAMILSLSLISNSAFAQLNIGNVLKDVVGSNSNNSGSSGSTTNDLLSGLTSVFSYDKVASMDDLAGSWTYTEPAVVFSSENFLKNAGGKVASAAMEKKLQSQLNKIGVTKGQMKMTFTKDGNFTQTIKGKTLKGTYTVDGKSVVLKYVGQVKQLVGTTQVDGDALIIVMDASKMLSYMKVLGAMSGNNSLKTASSLVGSMDGMQCGLRLNKE